MKKLLLSIIIIFVLFLLFKTQAEAHFLATDGSIGAILHVDPNDEPVAGEQSSFFFSFKDTQNKFDPAKCTCTFSILENGNIIFTQPLFANNTKPSLENASIFFTFPQKNVYQIKVEGKPQESHAFQSFTLTWNFRVDQQVTNQATSGQTKTNFFTQHLVHFLGIIVFVLMFLSYIIYQIVHKKNSTMRGGEKKDDKKDTRTIY